MGQSESSPEDFSSVETLGYRVLGVQPNSPASEAGLVSFFDFLVGCEGKMLIGNNEEDDVDFIAVLKDSVGKQLELLVFNIKSQSTRVVQMTPSDNWGGHGLLGVTIRLDDYADAEDRLVRVLSVVDNSPAQIAGLQAETDYLLGTSTVSFSSDEVLSQTLQAYRDKVVELYVYNTESDVVRVVNLMPTLSWGGQGLLGAEVGTGYLHSLPHKCRGTDGSSTDREIHGKLVNHTHEHTHAQPTAQDEVMNYTAQEPKQEDKNRVAEQFAKLELHQKEQEKEQVKEGQQVNEVQPPQQQQTNESVETKEPKTQQEVLPPADIQKDKTPEAPATTNPPPEPPLPPPNQPKPSPIEPTSVSTTEPSQKQTTAASSDMKPLPPMPAMPPPGNGDSACGKTAQGGYKSFVTPFLPPAPFMSKNGT